MSSAADPGVRGGALYTLIVLTLVNTVNWADRQVVPILFPDIREALALSDTQLGVIGGVAFSLIYAVAAFGFGYASDRRLRRNLIAFGLTAWSIATAATGLAVDFWSLFAARFFTGLGEASLYPCAMSLLAERLPNASRGRAMGIFGAAAAVGSGIGAVVGGWLAMTVGWREVFFLYGAVGLLLVPLVLSLSEEPRPAPTESAERALTVVGDLLRDRRLVTMWTAGLLMIGAGIGYAQWVPSFFVRYRGFDVAEIGMFIGATLLLGGILGSVLGGVLTDRRKKIRFAGDLDVAAIAAIVSAPLVAVILLVDWMPAYVIVGIVVTITIHAFFPALQTVLPDIVPARRLGMAYAVHVLFLGGIGSALGPTLIGVTSDVTGSLQTALFLVVAGMFGAALLAVRSGRLMRAGRDTDEAVAAGAEAGEAGR